MSLREEVEWWLPAARRDLRTAEILHRDEMFEGVAFYSRQAAEKALKTILVQMGHQEPAFLREITSTNKSPGVTRCYHSRRVIN